VPLTLELPRGPAAVQQASPLPALEFSGVGLRYGRRQALQGLTLRIQPGQFVLVAGPSGCGKSSLALAACGLIPSTDPALLEGEVRVFGLSTREHPVHILAKHVGIVFQSPAAQLFHGIVEEEVGFAPHNLGFPKAEIEERVAFALDSVGIRHLARRLPQSLSAGEKQRLAIAAALSLKPRLLVLDEPTANLDWTGVELLADCLRRLNREQGLTVLLIEHRLHAFCPLADRVLVLNEGRLEADGAPGEVLAARERLGTLGLRFPRPGSSNRLTGFLPRGVHPPDQGLGPLVELQDLSAAYGRRRVLHNVSFALFPGQFTALVGPNGAGKSTLAQVLSGLLRPQRGRVRWGRDLKALPLGRRCGFLFQNASCQLLLDTVAEEVSFAPRNLGLPVEEHCRLALASTGLSAFGQRSPTCLSLGEQQRTALAAVLSAFPRLLILDEPSIGQDWGHLERLMEYLRRLARGGVSILLITHDDKLVCRFAQRILHLRDGRLCADGPPRRETEQDPGEEG